MKNTRASIPIGTIAIIIIVLVASFGMWWYFTQAGKDCSDLVQRAGDVPPIHGSTYTHYWHKDTDPVPTSIGLQYVPGIAKREDGAHVSFYIRIDVAGNTIGSYGCGGTDPECLRNLIKTSGQISEGDKITLLQILDCI